MITEDYVSFETAKLLKKKGFDGECDYLYADGKLMRADAFACDWNKGETMFADYENECSAPTFQMAMKWLREVHKLHIEFVLNQYVQNEEVVIENHYHFNVSRLDRFANEGGDCKFYNSYEQVCESAIIYCLNNLI